MPGVTLGNTTLPSSASGPRSGAPPTAALDAPTPATRVTRSTWRDPRLWVGVVVVCASVVLGARVLAAADDTVGVWAVAADAPAGAVLDGDDLEAVQVRFGDGTDASRYLAVDQPLPEQARLVRAVAAGELLPLAALATGEEGADVLAMPVAVEPEQVSGSVRVGSTVQVYLVPREPVKGYEPGEPVLADVQVLEAPLPGEGIGATGRRSLVLAVPEDDVSGFYDLLGSLGGDPQVFVAAR